MDVSKNTGTPKSSILIGVFHYKPSVLGYHYFRKHPYISTLHFQPLRWMRKQTWRRRDEQMVSENVILSKAKWLPGDKKKGHFESGKMVFVGVCDVMCTLCFVDWEYDITNLLGGNPVVSPPFCGVFEKELCRRCVCFFGAQIEMQIEWGHVSMKFCKKKNGISS